MESLKAEGVDTIFGYPGGSIIPTFDALYDYRDIFNFILVRHEQAATHAAEGYARVSGKVGVVLLTSGPGATNAITGIADAMMDSTPMVVIAGQVASQALGSDAFQETDLVGITQPITKWSFQIRKAEDIAWAVSRAFYIASTGRPGPVVLDLTKDAQTELCDFAYKKCSFIRSYIPYPEISEFDVEQAAHIINAAKKPFALLGQGVILSNAEKEVMKFLEKANIPAATTLLGLSCLPSDHELNKGMLGMHGNYGPNMKTNECDVLIAIGMRFSDRVTGNRNTYAKQAKILHFDIDPSEIGKNITPTLGILGDIKESITMVTEKLKENNHKEWIDSFKPLEKKEYEKVFVKEVENCTGDIHMGEVVDKISKATGNKAVLVTDVGQNQIMSARYFKYKQTRSVITSGGLGTMGFGLPAAMGAKVGAPDRTVCAFCGDGGLQMTIEELGTIMQSSIGVKIILLNNNKLGMVRQWQELFWQKRYSFTDMLNPDFSMIASAYGIKNSVVEKREDLDKGIADMLKDDKAYMLIVNLEECGLVYPMTPAGDDVTNVLLEKK
jgi:acetolactate synthase-1/2/3 large subunit